MTKLLAVATALATVVVITIWVRSHFVWDQLRVSGDRRITLISARGVALFAVESKFSGQSGNYNYRNVVSGDRLWLGDQSARRVETFHFPVRSDTGLRTGPLGFSASRSDWTGGEGLFQSVREIRWQVSAPLWFCTVVPLAGCIGAICHLRKTSERVGICSHCGYDLRATPERCPECGAYPETGARTAAYRANAADAAGR